MKSNGHSISGSLYMADRRNEKTHGISGMKTDIPYAFPNTDEKIRRDLLPPGATHP